MNTISVVIEPVWKYRYFIPLVHPHNGAFTAVNFDRVFDGQLLQQMDGAIHIEYDRIHARIKVGCRQGKA